MHYSHRHINVMLHTIKLKHGHCSRIVLIRLILYIYFDFDILNFIIEIIYKKGTTCFFLSLELQIQYDELKYDKA